MPRVVRSSKYRHIFGKEFKNDLCYDNITITRTAWDSNYIAANNTYFAVCWQTAGGGSVGVVPHSRVGKLPQSGFPLITGHKNHVLDIAWHPFNESLLASVSEDCYGKIWQIPDGGLTENLTEPVQTLKGHRRKIGTVNFNPVANNIVATSSQDYTVKIWDIESGTAVLSLDGPSDLIQSVAWNYNGSQLALTCKDKKIRLGDVREEKFSGETAGHLGVKGSRCTWLNDGNLFTVGFGRTSERQYRVYDPRNIEKPLIDHNIDVSSGLLMPFYDRDTSVIYLAGKGDGNIRYFEYSEQQVFQLSQYSSNKSTRGGTFIPKTACSINTCEVGRFLKLEDRRVVPVSFTVPRKSDLFQDDIFPPTSSGAGEAALEAGAWLGGENADPVTVDLEEGFVMKEKPKNEIKFEKKVVDEGPKTLVEYAKALEAANKRITYLEAELHKKDLLLKEK